MLNKQSLHTILNLDISSGSPEVQIYTDHPSERLSYVCEFIFKHVLKLNVHLNNQLIEFEKVQGLKLNYSSKKIPGSFQIIPHGLLEQTGVSEQKPAAVVNNNGLYFYESKSDTKEVDNCFHFDIFSAVFYLISRYEEWQHFTPDKHKRFEADQSILVQNKAHLKPLVEIWINELKNALQQKAPTFIFPETHFHLISTIDVDNLYAYKSKGFLRTIGASIKDLLKADGINLRSRYRVLTGKEKDPFDIYESVSDFCFEKKIPLFYFFLFKTGDAFNRTVDPSSGAFQKVFQILKKNKAHIGVHPSYDAAYKNTLLEKEVKELALQCGEPITFSRQHYLRFDVKTTPLELIEQGIQADFTMGFASQAGFRAGTSFPFYYYDFNSEQKKNLLFIPFCVMDGAYTIYNKNGTEEAYSEMMELMKEIKKVNGFFITVFHERSFSDHLYPGFGTLYKKLHEEGKVT